MNSRKLLEEALMKADFVVLKRLKYIHKILKAITNPAAKNRSFNVHFLEILDAIGDASIPQRGDISELIDQEIFPILCQIISTLNQAEFCLFQRNLLRYTLIKWKETRNFEVLCFISDIYGFIVRIAPPSIIEEYIQLFSRIEVPPQISMLVFPSIIRNVKDTNKLHVMLHKINLPSSAVNLICTEVEVNMAEDEKFKQELVSCWCSGESTNFSCMSKTSTLQQYVYSSLYLNFLTESYLLKIVDSLANYEISDAASQCRFLLVCIIFLASAHDSLLKPESGLYPSVKKLFDCIVRNILTCCNDLNKFVVKCIQIILETTSDENSELLKLMEEKFCENGAEMEFKGEFSEVNLAMKTMEECIEKVRNCGFLEDEDCVKRIKHIVLALEDCGVSVS